MSDLLEELEYFVRGIVLDVIREQEALEKQKKKEHEKALEDLAAECAWD